MKDAVVLTADEAVVEQMDWGTLYWYANSQIGNCDTITVGKCVIKPGCENPKHRHPNCQEVLHVLSGRILHSAGGSRSFEMGPGQTITTPQGLSHNARNIGSDHALLMIAFSSGDRQTQGE